MSENFSIRLMTQADLEMAVVWAARKGWNPGHHDAGVFYETDPNGFFIGEMEGRPVGCISAVAYNKRFGFIGFNIVKPEFDETAFCRELIGQALAYLKPRNVGLDCISGMVECYREMGFKIAHLNHRVQMMGSPQKTKRADIELVELSTVSFNDLASYDRRCFPAPRDLFLSSWISMPNAVGFAAKTNDRLAGYGVIRSCREGRKIGPLFADDGDIAETLLLHLAAQAPGEPVYLDVPAANRAAVALTRKHRMKPMAETTRMYLQEDPDIARSMIFGVTSFELG